MNNTATLSNDITRSLREKFFDPDSPAGGKAAIRQGAGIDQLIGRIHIETKLMQAHCWQAQWRQTQWRQIILNGGKSLMTDNDDQQ